MSGASKLGHLPQVGEQIDRYRIVAEIAHGGMAAVFSARREHGGHFDKLLAMKVMLPHLASEERFVAMFLDEARIAAQIQHANVVQVFDVGSFRRTPYIVMEYLRGQSLSSLLRRSWYADRPSLPTSLVLSILASVAEGLHAAHEARGSDGSPLGVVHRDVSPQNVHVGYDGQAKVVDFGIAAAEGRITSTRTGELKGKLDYLAPEQLHQRFPVDRRADLWSFGVMAWSIFAKQRLFRGDTDTDTMWNVINRDVPELSEHASDLSEGVLDCIGRCLERQPHLRPSDAAEVATAFRQAAVAAGAWQPTELGKHLSGAFAAERAVEEERIAAAIRVGDPGPLVEAQSKARVLVQGVDITQPVTLATPSGTLETLRRKPIRGLVVAGVGMAIVAVVVGVTVVTAGETSDGGRAALALAAPEGLNAPGPSDPVEGGEARAMNSPEPTPRTEDVRDVRVDIADRVRLVLVNGQRHDERPLVLRIAEDETAAVDLFGYRGEERRVMVSHRHDGETLGLRAESASRRSRIRRAARIRRVRERQASTSMITEMGRDTPLMPVPEL